MTQNGLSEHIIQDVVGCGPFQLLHVLTTNLVSMTSAVFSMLMMSFGNYNPGWTCLDGLELHLDDATNHTNPNPFSSSSFSSNESPDQVYIQDNCSLFESCNNVQFSPEMSTVVSEWGLLCGKAWIPSVIISIQMAGVLVGGSIAGYLADAYGRKKVYFGAQAIFLVFNTLAVFSTSWQMFAAIRFFLGTAIACVFSLYYIYAAEFVPKKWRGPVAGAPFWPIICLLLVGFCMLVKTWRGIHIATAAMAACGAIPALWTPESLRWLETRKRTEQFEKTIRQMAKMNGKELPPLNYLEQSLRLKRPVEEEHEEVVEGEKEDLNSNSDSNKIYNTLHLFRGGYRNRTFLLTVPWISVSLIFYGLSFGVKALNGDFYINLIIFQSLDIPFSFLTMFAPNVFGRKKAAVMFAAVCGACLTSAAFLKDWTHGTVQVYGVLVSVTLGKLTVLGFWMILQLHTTELYPTVLRGLGVGWANMVARVGGILAPFIIPNEEDKFFRCYVIMAALILLVAAIMTRLPETKDKEMQNDSKQGEISRV